LTDEVTALGICLEEYEYPYPVRFLPLSSDLRQVSMAYGDIPPSTEPNGIRHLEQPGPFLARLLPFLAS
jgi:hypothetical protein